MSDNPKRWGDMTPEEKSALLLAHHEGKVIEYWNSMYEEWRKAIKPCWSTCNAYRVRPEPKIGLSVLFVDEIGDTSPFTATHTISYQTIDGIPDCDSIKMRPIK